VHCNYTSKSIRYENHKNYNPRIIEKLTDEKVLRNLQIEDSRYYSYFIDNLNNPLRVWQDLYDNLPNKLYKLTIIVRFLIEGELPVNNLEKAVNAIIENSTEYQSFSYDDFEYIMRDLEGTLFSFKNGVDELIEEECTLIEFQNPSIIDFVDSFIWGKTSWLNLTIKNAIYFEQLFNFELTEIIKNDSSLSKSFRDKILKDFHNLTNANIGYFEYIKEKRHWMVISNEQVIQLKKNTSAEDILKLDSTFIQISQQQIINISYNCE